jgi:prophage regulatory protein
MFESIVSVEEVVKMTGLSRTTIWRKRREGTFPRSVQISERRVGFRTSDLNAWMTGLGVAV